jgi:hypothetical protein
MMIVGHRYSELFFRIDQLLDLSVFESISLAYLYRSASSLGCIEPSTFARARKVPDVTLFIRQILVFKKSYHGIWIKVLNYKTTTPATN